MPSSAPPSPAAAAAPVFAVRVPRWLAADWFMAVSLAVLGLLIGLVIQILLSFLLVFAQVSMEGGTVQWAETMRAAVTMFLGLHGPVDQVGLWLTSLLWLWVAFRIGALLLAPERGLAQASGPRRGAFLAKVALVYMIPVTVLSAVLDPTRLPADNLGETGLLSSIEGTGYGTWNLAAGFFLGLAAMLLVVGLLLPRRTRAGLLPYYGLARQFTWPAFLAGGWAGARRTLLIALPATLVLMVIGAFLELASEDLSFRTWLAVALLVLYAAVMLAGVDVGAVYFLLSLRLFLGTDALFQYDRPSWVYVGIAIAVLAFLLGGYAAAERSRASTAGQAALAGLLVGPFVGLLMFVASWFTIGIGEAVVGPALGLPFLWAVVSAAGGLLFANRHGLISGLRFEVIDRASPTAPPPDDE